MTFSFHILLLVSLIIIVIFITAFVILCPGYYMAISPSLCQVGDKIRLTSPSAFFPHPTLISFRYGILSNPSGSPQTLDFILYRLLYVEVLRQEFAAPENTTRVTWESYSVCVPAGSYDVVFEATRVHAYSMTVVVDSVVTSSYCQPVVELEASSRTLGIVCSF